jgi:hypothetical protein
MVAATLGMGSLSWLAIFWAWVMGGVGSCIWLINTSPGLIAIIFRPERSLCIRHRCQRKINDVLLGPLVADILYGLAILSLQEPHVVAHCGYLVGRQRKQRFDNSINFRPEIWLLKLYGHWMSLSLGNTPRPDTRGLAKRHYPLSSPSPQIRNLDNALRLLQRTQSSVFPSSRRRTKRNPPPRSTCITWPRQTMRWGSSSAASSCSGKTICRTGHSHDLLRGATPRR